MDYRQLVGLGMEISAAFWHNNSVPQPGPAEPHVIDATNGGPPLPVAVIPAPTTKPREIGGPTGPDPTRFGDWERGGRCIDF